jgi:predicted DNA-binding protein YlxM (UPF0122 family)
LEYKIILDGIIKVNENGDILRLHKGNWEVASIFNTSRNLKYKAFTYMEDGKQKHEYVHRAVAFAFIPNPNNYSQINHIDGNPQNNDICNLEWCTASQNVQHAYKTGLINIYTNAQPCKTCGQPTVAKDVMCVSCKRNLKSNLIKDEKFNEINFELQNVDLSILTKKQKIAVEKRMQGFSLVEIANQEGVSKQCIDGRIYYALRKGNIPRKNNKKFKSISNSIETRLISKREKLQNLQQTVDKLATQINSLEKLVDCGCVR